MDIAVERRRRWRSPEQPGCPELPFAASSLPFKSQEPRIGQKIYSSLLRLRTPPPSANPLLHSLSVSRRETQKPASSFRPALAPSPSLQETQETL
ncbi:hypothetical protein NL676_030363 [Syzygium grande]|nr:hypothetical protein NL676_030363 [Syzygium grande]